MVPRPCWSLLRAPILWRTPCALPQVSNAAVCPGTGRKAAWHGAALPSPGQQVPRPAAASLWGWDTAARGRLFRTLCKHIRIAVCSRVLELHLNICRVHKVETSQTHSAVGEEGTGWQGPAVSPVLPAGDRLANLRKLLHNQAAKLLHN